MTVSSVGGVSNACQNVRLTVACLLIVAALGAAVALT